MMANTIIPIFSGGNNGESRKYYTISDGTDKEAVYYDINYPLELALKEAEMNEFQCGFRDCLNCRAYGMQNNIAIMPCSNCIDTLKLHRKYKCHIADATMNPCGPNCTWFSPTHGLYCGVTPGDFCLQTLHVNTIDNNNTDEVANILGSIRSLLTERFSTSSSYIERQANEESSDSEDDTT